MFMGSRTYVPPLYEHMLFGPRTYVPENAVPHAKQLMIINGIIDDNYMFIHPLALGFAALFSKNLFACQSKKGTQEYP